MLKKEMRNKKKGLYLQFPRDSYVEVSTKSKLFLLIITLHLYI